MIDIDITIVIQLCIFLITLVALNLILFRPIRDIIKKRDAHISGMLAEAERFNDDAESKLTNYEAQLAEARAAGVAERNARKGEAQEEEKTILQQALAETQAQLKEVREQVAKDVDTAMTTLKGQVDTMAQKAAAKVLG